MTGHDGWVGPRPPSTPLQAPDGAVAWTPADGWLYEPHEVPQHVADGDVVLVVSDDGYVRGVTPSDRAPLAALLRVDADLAEVVARLGDLAEVVARLGDLADRVAGQDVSEATDVAALHTRVNALARRVDRLEGRTP